MEGILYNLGYKGIRLKRLNKAYSLIVRISI